MKWPGFTTALRRGLVAGAAGTTAIEVATYLDMALRDRPSSTLPKRAAGEIARRAGLELTENRAAASGALLGYADGLFAGVVYGLLRSVAPVPVVIGALALAAGTLVMSEGGATRLGVTDWAKWNAGEWIEDILPRLVYGSITALAMDILAQASERTA
jgi:hypothetical protein